MKEHSTIKIKKSSGFTLIELMIVVTVIAIIGAIALPGYRNYVIKASRSEAKSALTTAAAYEEQYFSSNKTYTTNLADLSLTALTESGKYSLSVDAPTATCPIAACFALTAAPQGGQTEDTECGDFTLNSSGEKGADSADCW